METSDWIVLIGVLIAAAAVIVTVVSGNGGLRERLARLEAGQEFLGKRIDRLEDRKRPDPATA